MRFLERGGDPAVKLQRDLEGKLKGAFDRRVDNAARAMATEAKLAEACVLVEQLALGADDAALDRALQAKRGCEDKIGALRVAATRIGEEVSEIEAQIDKVVDQRCRAETSIAVNAMADELAEAQADFTKGAQRLEAAARQGGLIVPESRAVAEFTLSAYTQLEPAVEMVTAALRQHARGVLSGHYAPSLPRPAPAAPVLMVVGPPPEPTMNVFAIRSLKYVAADGSIAKIGKYKRADVPKHLAELALSSGVALPISDKRMRDLEQTASPLQPDESSCEWVGPPGKEAPPVFMRPGGAVVHSAFQPHPDYADAKPITGTLPRGPEPEPLAATGTRNLTED
jgi:hypothetical protein